MTKLIIIDKEDKRALPNLRVMDSGMGKSLNMYIISDDNKLEGL